MTNSESDRSEGLGYNHQFLLVSTRQRRDRAWQIAQHERSQRDDYTSKVRFGLVAANAASLLTVINLKSELFSLSPSTALLACVFFLVGLICSGYSLLQQQTYLITQAGKTAVVAMHLDAAAALSEAPGGTKNFDLAQERRAEAAEVEKQTFQLSIPAIVLQNCGSGAWLGGALLLSYRFAYPYLPNILQF